MPKNQVIDPRKVRSRGAIEFAPIPVNEYQGTVADALKAGLLGGEDLVRIQRDMAILRAFESMLNEVKLTNAYKGIQYSHGGPAHLSIGQEAAAVGQAIELTVDDHIYGSHRSHSEILAKGLSSIHRLDEAALDGIMKNYFDGACLKVVEGDAAGSVKDLAIDFLIYGALAEIFARSPGFNKGIGGSMHAFFPPFGVYPNNAIVGGSGDIAVGAALFKRVNHKPGIVIANIGDASLGCGPVWEGLCFATMDQFRQLWDGEHGGGLPLIVNFVNNHYGMGGQPVGETMGFGMLARLGAGLNPQQMHAERIDGFNPLAVADAVRRKKAVLAAGEGPVLLDTITYRFSGHSPSDASSYRTKEEVAAWQEHDPLVTYARQLVEAGLAAQADIDAMNAAAEALVMKAFTKAIDESISPREPLMAAGTLLDRTMFSNLKVESLDPTREPEVLMPRQENPRVKMLAARSRTGLDENGQPLPKGRCIQVRDALFEAILDRFYADPTLVAYGEENRDWGGAFAVYRGLTEALPYHRLFNSPISEGAIVGTAVGYALEGGRPLVELMYCDF
ncbi:MAG: dehydrogenase, partial [Planctomycetes bacterium]|nr:dehydrogenase [Planctomycetota bacterium]